MLLFSVKNSVKESHNFDLKKKKKNKKRKEEEEEKKNIFAI